VANNWEKSIKIDDLLFNSIEKLITRQRNGRPLRSIDLRWDCKSRKSRQRWTRRTSRGILNATFGSTVEFLNNKQIFQIRWRTYRWHRLPIRRQFCSVGNWEYRIQLQYMLNCRFFEYFYAFFMFNYYLGNPWFRVSSAALVNAEACNQPKGNRPISRECSTSRAPGPESTIVYVNDEKWTVW